MSYEVVVVGGGIGGLTVAALLSARGVKTCLLERQSQVGGCVARVEISGLNFEPGMGVYPSWGAGEIHEKVFSELPVKGPPVRALDSAYVVRLADGTDVRLKSDDQEFAIEINRSFPESAAEAIAFYARTVKVAAAWRRALDRKPNLLTASPADQIRAFLPEATSLGQLLRLRNRTAIDGLRKTSSRFQCFIDTQLRTFAQTPVEQCAFVAASLALDALRQRLYSILGGPASLAECLAESIGRSGGVVRLNSPVLRLAYDSTGRPAGVDLLSGETVFAKQAIVSNMTVWDTYGKLIGLGRTPTAVKQKLATLQSSGAYVIYAAIEERAVERLPAENFLVATQSPQTNTEEDLAEFSFAAPAASRAAPGKRAATILTTADVGRWFTFHTNEEEHETRDQEMLGAFWKRIHRALPVLGGDIEVLETANPLTYYELTRRKLGMVRGTQQTSAAFGSSSMSHVTSLPKVFMVGDTVFPGTGLAAVSHSGLVVANEITGRKR